MRMWIHYFHGWWLMLYFRPIRYSLPIAKATGTWCGVSRFGAISLLSTQAQVQAILCYVVRQVFSCVSFHDSPTMYYYSAYIQTVKWLWWLMAEHQAMQVVLYISPPLPRSNCFAFFQRGPFMCVYGDDWRDGFHSNGHLLQIRMFCCYLALQYFQVVELHNWHTPAQLKVGKKVWRYNWGRDFPTRTQQWN